MRSESNENLRKCLSLQIERLKIADPGKSVINAAERLMYKLPETLDVETENGWPLLLVVPFEAWPFREQLGKVRYRDRGSLSQEPVYSFLKIESVVSELPTFTKNPYILVDVESGVATQGLSPMRASAKITLEGGAPFAIEHCLAVALQFPGTFHHRNLYAAASQMSVGGEMFTLDFWVYAQKIKMKRDSDRDGDPRWGTPSYKDVITL